jgi:hypothetical protein
MHSQLHDRANACSFSSYGWLTNAIMAPRKDDNEIGISPSSGCLEMNWCASGRGGGYDKWARSTWTSGTTMVDNLVAVEWVDIAACVLSVLGFNLPMLTKGMRTLNVWIRLIQIRFYSYVWLTKLYWESMSMQAFSLLEQIEKIARTSNSWGCCCTNRWFKFFVAQTSESRDNCIEEVMMIYLYCLAVY